MAATRIIRLREGKHETSTIKLMHSGLISFPPSALMEGGREGWREGGMEGWREGGLLVGEDESERRKLPSGMRQTDTRADTWLQT